MRKASKPNLGKELITMIERAEPLGSGDTDEKSVDAVLTRARELMEDMEHMELCLRF